MVWRLVIMIEVKTASEIYIKIANVITNQNVKIILVKCTNILTLG